MQGNVFDVNDSWKVSDDGKVLTIVREIKSRRKAISRPRRYTTNSSAARVRVDAVVHVEGLYGSRFVARCGVRTLTGLVLVAATAAVAAAIAAVTGASTVLPGRPGASGTRHRSTPRA